jgi:hypothetical protein
MFKPVQSLVLVSFAAVAASAAPPATSWTQFVRASGPQCFRASGVSRFVPGPPGFVIVRTEGSRWFQMRLSPGCPDFRLIMQIGVRPNDSDWLCEGKADELGGLPPDTNGRCFVSDIRELAPGSVPGTV